MFVCLFQEAERQRKEADQQQEDEEGWVKVTKGPKGTKARPHSEAANKRTLQKELKKKKRKELMNFYTWQHRNTQKERKCQFVFVPAVYIVSLWCGQGVGEGFVDLKYGSFFFIYLFYLFQISLS